MIKSISYPADQKIKRITIALFGDLSAAESRVLDSVIAYQSGGTLGLTKLMIDYMMESTALSRSGLSTALLSLSKKGVIKKESKTVILHPIYLNVDQLEALVIKFSDKANIAEKKDQV